MGTVSNRAFRDLAGRGASMPSHLSDVQALMGPWEEKLSPLFLMHRVTGELLKNIFEYSKNVF